jgi:hypothetical protein
VNNMATCGHCHKTGQTVAHVRTCGGFGTELHEAMENYVRALPDLEPGMAVTLANADGYWVVVATGVSSVHHAEVEQLLPTGQCGANAYVHASEMELVFPNAQAANEYRIATAQEARKAQVRETLHGSADYCKGCAKGWAGAKWHRDGCPVVATRDEAAPTAAPQPAGDVWAPVQKLRNAVKAHLHYETKQGTHKRVGHFAVTHEGTLKFLVIKELMAGRYAGRVFVDSMGSDTAYPVKTPTTLTAYLTAVLADPDAAAKRYSDEMGQCNMCDRPLTNDLSRQRGIGPECWERR